MKLFITAVVWLFSCSIYAQSILFVYVSGNNNGSAYTRIELNGVNIGTLGVKEHLVTDFDQGSNKLTFHRRGYNQLEQIIFNENNDHFIQINVAGKKWKVNEYSLNEMPDFTSSIIQEYKRKNEEKAVTLNSNYSNGVMPEVGSTILTLINDEAECPLINPDVISNYVNAVFLRQYRIVNRNELSAILDEQKLSLSGLISFDESIEAGNLIGAKFSLVVSYQCLPDSEKIILTLNLINCETSQIEWVGILDKVRPSEISSELTEIIENNN